MSRYRFIRQYSAHYPVRQLCHVLAVSPSAYYAWSERQRQPAPAATVEQLVVRTFHLHAGRYGTRRLQKELAAHGLGRQRLATILRRQGLRARQPRAFVPQTTRSNHGQRVAPNRLRERPAPTGPDQVWVGDITYLPRQGGGCFYLATWLDRCTRRVVGWHVLASMPAELVSEALRRALVVRKPAAGLVVHSDRGSQYNLGQLQPPAHPAPGPGQHEPQEQLLRQCPCGILLEPAQNGAARGWQLPGSQNGPPETQRVRRLLQPPATPLRSRLPLTC